MGSNIDYINMGPWPVHVGFTQDEKAFKAELERLGFEDGPDMIPSSGGNAGTHRIPTAPITFIITMQPDIAQYEYRQIAGLLATKPPTSCAGSLSRLARTSLRRRHRHILFSGFCKDV